MKRYPVYKDSGIDWLEEIPEHWQQSSIRALTKSVVQRNHPDLPLLAVYRDYGVIHRDSRDDNHNRVPEDLSNYKVVKPGNLVLNKMKTWQGSLGVSEFEGIVSPAYIICEVCNDVHSRFLHYLLRCYRYIFIYNKISYGVRVDQWDMHYEDFKQIPIFLPSLEEQKAITHFIDRKLGQIEHFIRNKQRLIELLNEQKTAIINRAVTKGINTDAVMKHSGIEWLGEIPAYWEVKRAKQVSYVFVPQRNKPELNFNIGFPWITMEDITSPSISKSSFGYLVSESDAINAGSKLLPENSVIASCVGNFGVSSVNTVPVIINQQLQAYIPIKINPYYLRYLIAISKSYFEQIATATTLAYVNQAGFAELPVTLPPTDEQLAILSFLDKELTKVDIAIAKAEREIELIQEYRTTLISDAVTGKIDVREFDNDSYRENSPSDTVLAAI